MAHEWVGVAIAGGDGAGDPSSLPAELEVIEKKLYAVGVRDRNVEDAKDEAGPEDADWSAESESGRREEEFEAGEHAESIVEVLGSYVSEQDRRHPLG
jgi:hypothetical protein